MARVPENYEVGNRDNMTPEKLLDIIEDIYRQLAVALNRKPDVVTRNTDGQTTETFLSNGDININLSTNKVEMLTNHVDASTVTWTTLS